MDRHREQAAAAQQPKLHARACRHQPRASDEALMRLTVGSIQPGMRKPSRLATRPDAVAMMSGLRSSSRTKPWPPWRAMGHTAATLNSGTHANQHRNHQQALRACQARQLPGR